MSNPEIHGQFSLAGSSEATARSDDRLESARALAAEIGGQEHESGHHLEKIKAYVGLICENLGCDPEYTAMLSEASPMHDVGKLGISPEILAKPGGLDAYERAEIERHAELGYELLAGTGNEVLDMAASIALTHHERFDGCGYPRGLSGEEIPLEGRIVAVADVFDALTADRAYRPAFGFDTAIAIIREGRGSHFDPRIADAFLADSAALSVIYRSVAKFEVPEFDQTPTLARGQRHLRAVA